jgi:NMD protein affecting ribosome stability and mRNA decay
MTDKSMIRSLNRKGSRSNRKPPVATKLPAPLDKSVCERCGATYVRGTWRATRKLALRPGESVRFTVCPACKQVERGESHGRLILRGKYVGEMRDMIERRIANVARRAAATQPERKLVSSEFRDGTLEVRTTSQKLAHRIARELCKAFGGKAAYAWSDDGALDVVWTRAAAR